MSTPHRHPDVTPLEFLQLAGHPLRWRLLEELARSDRMVHELIGLVGGVHLLAQQFLVNQAV